MLVSVDVGSGYTKWRAQDRRGLFPSSVGALDKDRFHLNGTAQTVRMAEGRFAVAEYAEAHIEPSKRGNTLTREWPFSQEWMALLFSAIAQAAPKGYKGDVFLATGLPTAVHGEDAPKLKAHLIGNHKFGTESGEYSINFRADRLWVIPQVMGVFLNALNSQPALANSRVGVIDPGTLTTGYAIVDNLNFRSIDSGGDTVGVSRVIALLQHYLADCYGMSCTPERVRTLLADRELVYRDKRISIGTIIDDFASDVMFPLIQRIDAHWSGARDIPIILGGGGAKVFANAFRRIWPHIKVPASDSLTIYDVVDGFHYFGAAKSATPSQRSKAG